MDDDGEVGRRGVQISGLSAPEKRVGKLAANASFRKFLQIFLWRLPIEADTTSLRLPARLLPTGPAVAIGSTVDRHMLRALGRR